MELKLDEYFAAGVRLVWYIDPGPRSACLFTARDQVKTIGETAQLEGGEVLPGFALRLSELFERPSAGRASRRPRRIGQAPRAKIASVARHIAA